jgi:uncharacterized protein with HEPN domain
MKPHHSDKARLFHARDAIEQIFIYLEEDASRGSRTRDAIIRQLEIIGEACNHVSKEVKEQNPQIVWRDIVAMRNHLSHGYFQVEMNDVWDTVDNDLQPLFEQILVLLEQLD